MKRNIFIIAALMIFIIGCIALLNRSAGNDVSLAQPVVKDIARDDSVNVPGKIVELGSQGYVITLPAGYSMAFDEDDSIFRITPDIKDTGCVQRLRIEFTIKPLVVPGMRVLKSMTATILNQSVIFREYQPIGWTCHERSGHVALKDRQINIICDAPPGERLEKLYAIGISLQAVK